MRLTHILLSASCLVASFAARAEQAPQWWGVASIGSYHFESADEYLGPGQSFNESNLGAGLEVQWRKRHGVAAGVFRNSVDETSRYVLYQYTPLDLGRFVRVGGALGVVDGYPGYSDGDFAPGGGFLLKAEGERLGANLILLPRIPDSTPWTLGLQVKVRFGR